MYLKIELGTISREKYLFFWSLFTKFNLSMFVGSQYNNRYQEGNLSRLTEILYTIIHLK
jgi:hypothetical protein